MGIYIAFLIILVPVAAIGSYIVGYRVGYSRAIRFIAEGW